MPFDPREFVHLDAQELRDEYSRLRDLLTELKHWDIEFVQESSHPQLLLDVIEANIVLVRLKLQEIRRQAAFKSFNLPPVD